MTSNTTQSNQPNGSESANKSGARKTGGNKGKSNNRKGKNQKWTNSKKRNKRKGGYTFIENNEEMKGHVFQLKSETTSVLQFTKTIEQLVRYISSKC